jgi:hypothetical protein
MKKAVLLVAAGLFAAHPAHAEIKSQSDFGFISGHSAEVLAKPDDVWKRLIVPKEWWNPAHSWSGTIDGFYIDAQAGGCFCELIQEKAVDGKTTVTGSVEHMRVIFVDRNKVLRMQGALGPLQSEAVLATLTIAMEPAKTGGGTKLSFSYVVGGYMRFPVTKMAPAVDAVLAEQFASLIKPLGKIAASTGKADATTQEEKKSESARPEQKSVTKKAEQKDDEEWSLDLDTLEEEKPGSKGESPAAKSTEKSKPDTANAKKSAPPKDDE